MKALQPLPTDGTSHDRRVRCGTLLLLISLFLVVFGLLTGRAASQEPPSIKRGVPFDEPIATRLVPLYYMRDAEKVIAMVRGPEPPTAPVAVAERTEIDPLQSLQEQQRLLQSQRANMLARLAAQPTPAQSNLPPNALLEAAGFTSPAPSLQQELAKVERDLRALSEQEQVLRSDAFRAQAQRQAAASVVVSEGRRSSDAAGQVSISVIGGTQLHLRGPLQGVNAITQMIHEIDQPTGEVKIGIHVVQFTETEDLAPDAEPVSLELYLGHGRQMSLVSQTLFRAALSNVAARCQATDPGRFEETFFYAPCVRNFHLLNGSQTLLSVPLLDSRDIVTTLYLAAVANQEPRREVVKEFLRLVSSELPKWEAQYQRSIAAAQKTPSKAFSLLPRVPRLKSWTDADESPRPQQPDRSFSKTIACLNSFCGQANSATPIQVATVRFQRASLELRQAQAAIHAMRTDRLLVAAAPYRSAQPAHVQTVSTSGPDAVSLDALTGRVIEEQAQRVLDLQEVVRCEVAVLDGQLKRLTSAFEEDVRRQFYRPVLNDLRRNAGNWSMRMGQVQTTTIRTNDRMLARVSPAQTAVLDRAANRVLLQEGLQVAQGLAGEAQALAQAGSLQAAGNAFVPGSAALLAQTGMMPKVGAHLDELVEPTERLTVSVGDEISLTPIIQPDGASVAFHLVYAHTPRREEEANERPSGGVERHLVEANVNVANLEFQEVSRFRVALGSDKQGRGIPLLEDIPLAGTLFRPRRSAASTTQENVILVEAVIYPTAMAMSGKGRLASDAAPTGDPAKTPAEAGALAVGQDDLTRWVLQNLRRQAEASLAPPARQAQREAFPAAAGPVADMGHPRPR